MISLPNDNSGNNGCGLWKYNSFLAYNEFYVKNMKKLITKINTSNEFNEDAQIKWEFLNMKFENLRLITQKKLAKQENNR